MSLLESVLKQAEEKQAAANKVKVDGKELLKKYFIPRVEDGQTQSEFTFRILPEPSGDATKLFAEAYFYNLKINGKYRKVYSIAKNDKLPDPIFLTWETLRKTGDESDKKLAMQYSPQKFYIVKGIEIGKEHEGVKFWRFRDNYKGQGVYDKIIPIFKKMGDITNVEQGVNLSIMCGKDDKGNSIITTIIPEFKSKLTNDDEMNKAFLADTTHWKDIFRKEKEANVDFLEAVVAGKVPYWDNDLKKMVTPGENTVTNPGLAPKVDTTSYTDASISDDVEDDELPF